MTRKTTRSGAVLQEAPTSPGGKRKREGEKPFEGSDLKRKRDDEKPRKGSDKKDDDKDKMDSDSDDVLNDNKGDERSQAEEENDAEAKRQAAAEAAEQAAKAAQQLASVVKSPQQLASAAANAAAAIGQAGANKALSPSLAGAAAAPGSPVSAAAAAAAAAKAIVPSAAPHSGGEHVPEAPEAPAPPSGMLPPAPTGPVVPRRDGETDDQRSAWAAKGGLKKGPFSKKENDILKEAFDEYCKEHNLTEDDRNNMIESRKHSRKYRGVWQRIAERLPERSILSIYDHCSRHFHRGNYSGKWKDEEVQRLRDLVTTHGRDWKTIGGHLARLPCTCRDKWREIQFNPNKGTWSETEDDRLLSIIRNEQGVDDNKKLVLKPMLWSTIAKQMDNTRTPLACRAAWIRLYSKICCPELSANTPDFDNDLIKKLYELGADHKSEVRWSALNPMWPGRRCRVRFDQLKKGLEGHENMDFGTIVGRLYDKFITQKNAPNNYAAVPAQHDATAAAVASSSAAAAAAAAAAAVAATANAAANAGVGPDGGVDGDVDGGVEGGVDGGVEGGVDAVDAGAQ